MIPSWGASAFAVISKRTWSLPFPVHPCAMASAPCSKATSTSRADNRGRPSAVCMGYMPS